MAPGLIKICGVKTVNAAIAAAEADFIGFVFVPTSPRHITPEAASDIVSELKQYSYEEGFEPPRFVGLFVDAGEKLLAEASPFLSHFQFHGHEDADRINAMRAEFGVEIIKAVAIAEAADFGKAADLAEAADLILLDAMPPKGADRPGGHGAVFDWSLLTHYASETPFLLAGGLTADNVAAAVGAAKGNPAFSGVDVSSGVESQPGAKDAALIARFIKAARRAF